MEAKEKEVREMQYNVEDLIHKAEKKELVFNTAIGEQIAGFEARLSFTNDELGVKAERVMKKAASSMRESLNRDLMKLMGTEKRENDGKEDTQAQANTSLTSSQKLLKQEKEIEQHFGPKLLNSLDEMYLKAKVLQFTEKYEQAEKQFLKIIEINEVMRGANHLKTITAIYEYAVTIAGMQRYEEAQNIFKEIVAKRAQIKGEEDPETLEWKRNISKILKQARRKSQKGDVKEGKKLRLPAIQATH